MDLLTLIVLLAFASMFWPLWVRGRQAREQVMKHLRRHCQAEGLQLLDDTVELSHFRLRWNRGRPQAVRTYEFEFSAVGDDRYPGLVVLAGYRIESVQLTPHRMQ